MRRKEQKTGTYRQTPTSLRDLTAVTVCKAVRAGLRILGRGGTTLPGKAALFLSPKVLETVSDGMEIFVVTGTNGKTTTAGILAQALAESGRDVLINSSGANLLSGITAEFACDTDLHGRPRRRWAVVECDEGALRQAVPLLHPRVILVTNLFRDQLDRYGEVMQTLDRIRAGIPAADSGDRCTVCLNADDSLVSSLAESPAASSTGPVPQGKRFRIRRFGLGPLTAQNRTNENADAQYCIRCGARYEYRYHTFAHLGGFFCPECGYERVNPETEVTEVLAADADSVTVRMRTADAEQEAGNTKLQEVRIGLPALYNVYNAAGAVCAWQAAGLPAEEILQTLPLAEGSFGRMERFDVSGRQVRMILAKNPAGCDQALSYLEGYAESYRLVLGLNDRTADGHDISWIWDADFEKIASDPGITECLVTGDRAEDMCLRMVYAGMPAGKIRMVKEEKELLEQIEQGGEKRERMEMGEAGAPTEPVLILVNYTVMLQLRETLRKRSGKRAFWENGGRQEEGTGGQVCASRPGKGAAK